MKPITVMLDQSKETKGPYRFDSPDLNAVMTQNPKSEPAISRAATQHTAAKQT